MGVKLPHRSDSSGVPVPTAVRRFENGRFPGEALVPCGLRSFVMVEPAARAMRAMVVAARADGHELSATGTWRSYERQRSMFLERYVPHNTGHGRKIWNGTAYWKRTAGVASAATPGRSNHGLGLAVDLSDSPTARISDRNLRWLAAHGPSFGFWNTVRSERWHWSYCLGDDVPDGVAPIEVGHGVAPPEPIDWTGLEALEAALGSTMYQGLLKKGSKGDAVRALQWKLRANGHDIEVDGTFGKNTNAAVRGFQLANDLEVDGRVEQVMWRALGLPTAERPADEAIYVVQHSDGFLKIARRTLWSTSFADAKAIAKTNGLDVAATIHPGDRLRIPRCRSTVVGANDSWTAIAERLSRSVDEVRQANEWQGDRLHEGFTIYGGPSDG